MEVFDPIGVRQGDWVEIRFSGAALWSGVLWGILMPLGAMVGGAATGWSFGPDFGWSSTAAGSVAGFSALTAAFAVGLLVQRKKGGSNKYLPAITRTLMRCPWEDVSSAGESEP